MLPWRPLLALLVISCDEGDGGGGRPAVPVPAVVPTATEPVAVPTATVPTPTTPPALLPSPSPRAETRVCALTPGTTLTLVLAKESLLVTNVKSLLLRGGFAEEDGRLASCSLPTVLAGAIEAALDETGGRELREALQGKLWTDLVAPCSARAQIQAQELLLKGLRGALTLREAQVCRLNVSEARFQVGPF